MTGATDHAHDSQPDAIARAVETLRAGGIVAFPTETVYGLGADAWNPAAVRRVFELKGRPSTNPLIVHVTGPEMARTVSSQWPEWAERLARAFWPGPLTLVVPRADRLPLEVTAGGPTVAVRAPAHPAAMSLLYQFGGPLVGPSANRSGRVSPTTAAHVQESFGFALPVIDGGRCSAGIESTVVMVDGAAVRVLRPGVIGPSAIAAVLGLSASDIQPASASDIQPASPRAGTQPHPAHAAPLADPLHAPLQSPGLLAEHYAPVAPAVLFQRQEWPRVVARAAALEAGTPAAPAGIGPPAKVHGVALLSFGPMNVSDAACTIEMPADPSSYAANLYAALRAADAAAPALIAIETPPRPGIGECAAEDAELWHSIADRLHRAARRLA